MACDEITPPNQTSQPLFLHHGADFELAFTYQDSDGVARDITGYEFGMVVVGKNQGGKRLYFCFRGWVCGYKSGRVPYGRASKPIQRRNRQKVKNSPFSLFYWYKCEKMGIN